MAEKGHVWTDAETRLLLEIWSQDTIQRQLKGAFRNVNVFAQVVEELRKSGYHRTVQQCRIKIKSLKKKYKGVVDRARRSGAGNESDKEEDLPSDFAYFSQIDAVMAGRPNVKPVHLLDSAFYEEEHEMGAGEREVVSPVLSPDQSVTPSSQPEIPSPSVSQSETPGSSVSQPETPGPSMGQPETPGPSVSQPQTPASSASWPEPPLHLPAKLLASQTPILALLAAAKKPLAVQEEVTHPPGRRAPLLMMRHSIRRKKKEYPKCNEQ